MGVTKSNQAGCFGMSSITRALPPQRLINRDGAPFAGRHSSLGYLKALEFEGYGVHSGGDLYASRSEPAGGIAVHENFSAGRIGSDLSPRHVIAGAQVELGIDLRLAIVLHLHAGDKRIVALQAQNKIVLSGSQRQGHWSLPGLLGAIDEHVRTRRVAGDVQASSQ
jgi:hypothetical protein